MGHFSELFTLHRFECTCLTFDHNVRFEVDNEIGTISISVPLNHWLPWWKRIWLAIKYVFGKTQRYGHYDTIQLNPNDYEKIKTILDQSEKILNNKT